MPLQIIRNDITKMDVDVIVNAANSALKMGGGVCGAIFKAAGAKELQAECDSIGGCETGNAVITRGYKLTAKHIIHTVGPVWNGGNNDEEKLLRSCYIESLNLAKKFKLESIAFPLISSGIYGYPKGEAFKVAVTAIQDFLLENEMMVYLIVFDKAAVEISEKLYTSIEKYIDDKYVDENAEIRENRFLSEEIQFNYSVSESKMSKALKGNKSLEDIVFQLEETFSEMLLRLIDEKEMTDVETYKKANIDRKLFSKIRTDKYYKPRKATALALCIALELNVDQTKDLLGRAGYALSHSSRFDIIVEYFIAQGVYNIFVINEALFAFEENLLGV